MRRQGADGASLRRLMGEALMRVIRWVRLARLVLILILGLVAPTVLLYQAHEAISNLDNEMGSSIQVELLSKAMPAPTQGFNSANDYALFSLALVESNSFRALINKQRMKIAVMHVGFAIASVGLLFIVFGVDQGGIEAGGEAKTVAWNLKIASTGVAVFVLGSLLAGAGGLIANPYETAGIPGYAGTSRSPATPSVLKKATVQLCIDKTVDEKNMTACILNSL